MPLTVALPVMVAFTLLLYELSCAFTSTCVLLQRQPQVVFHVSASYIFYSIGVLQLVAATMCVLSAMPYPAALLFLCVMCYM